MVEDLRHGLYGLRYGTEIENSLFCDSKEYEINIESRGINITRKVGQISYRLDLKFDCRKWMTLPDNMGNPFLADMDRILNASVAQKCCGYS